MSDAPLRAVLFDVGGPIVDERADYDRIVDVTAELLTRELGTKVTSEDVLRERDKAIRAWTSSGNRAAIWHYLQPDKERYMRVYREVLQRVFGEIEDLTLMPGVEELIPRLAKKYVLAIAANQPSVVREKLEEAGLLRHFKSTLVSEDLKLEKPDTRFFLAVCDRIDIAPESCCMIGDRLDNDIYPANILGMRTIQIKMGPHAEQEPRIPEDVPDAVIEHMSEVEGVLESWESKGN